MKQKREYKRFGFKGNVKLKERRGGEEILGAYLDDIGLGGIRVRSESKAKLGESVKLAVMTPFLDRPLMAKGRIKHISSVRGTGFYSTGIEFTRVNRQKVKRLINKNFGWRERALLSRQQKREFSMLMKFLPVVIVAAVVIVGSYVEYNYNNIVETEFREKVKDGVVYFLYNS